MPIGGVKITKSPIIQQICQFEVQKLAKFENKLLPIIYNTFQALNCVHFLYSLKDGQINAQE
jgi:hypothetical protein